jgi:hypothetical protein
MSRVCLPLHPAMAYLFLVRSRAYVVSARAYFSRLWAGRVTSPENIRWFVVPLGLVRARYLRRATTLASPDSSIHAFCLLLRLRGPILLPPRRSAPLVGFRMRNSCYCCRRCDAVRSILLPDIMIYAPPLSKDVTKRWSQPPPGTRSHFVMIKIVSVEATLGLGGSRSALSR